jgi:multimeric flavodoxin WrbA
MEVVMRVAAFNGSPHAGGTTYRGLLTMTEELKREGVSVEIIHVGNEVIHGCIGCQKCRELGKCVFDDAVNRAIETVNQADGLILGSPVYYGGIAGTFKCFLDRLFYTGPDTKRKVGAAVAALRRSGGIGVYQQLNNYLHLGQMIITPSQYWGVIHGNNAEETLRDEEGMQIMRTMGRNMAWLLKALEGAKKTLAPPAEEPRLRTNFIRTG